MWLSNNLYKNNVMIRFAIIGAGWRTEFFLRVAQECPQRFEVCGVLGRNPEKAAQLGAQWRVPIVSTLDELLALEPDFVLVSVPWDVAPEMTLEVSRRNFPVLCETPPATSEDDLFALHQAVSEIPSAKIQVAEQYAFQPLHAARLNVIERGWIGRPSFAHVSVAHGYHGISLLRRYLGIGFDLPRISARSFTAPIVSGPDRDGPPSTETQNEATQVLAHFDWEGQLGIYDFCGEQYFSWVRGQHVLVRGEKGEIHNQNVRRLLDFQTPMTTELRREVAGACGNLEGFHLKGYSSGEHWLYQNPFAPGRLTDDEIAVAACLDGMAKYVQGEEAVYSLEEAMQDRYLDIWMEKALQLGQPVQPPVPPWVKGN